MTDRTILIIGAGIGGLSAGCYAQMNGYKTKIVEMHARPGGLCTAWTRNGYSFDGCIHNLAGTAPNSVFYSMWRELGVIPAIKMQRYDELVRYESADGQLLTIHNDLDRLEARLKAVAPEDAALISDVVAGARAFTKIDWLGLAAQPMFERIKTLVAAAPVLWRFGRYSLDQFARRFKSGLLREAFPTLIYDWPNSPMLFLLSFLGRMQVGDLGWPSHGSAAFADAIAHRFRELGGEIQYHAKVQSILVENGRAVGVKFYDGNEERADIVISNANGFSTIYGMLGGTYTSRSIEAYYARPDDNIEMGIHVSLGVNRDLSAEPHAIILALDKPVVIAGVERRRLYLEPFAFDKTLAPAGKSALKVVMATSYQRWLELAREPKRYQAEKDQIAKSVIALLNDRFPGLAGQIEVVDVATPMTTQRYTGNGHGYRTSAMDMMSALTTGWRLSQTLPGLKNFHMVGQWAGIAGVPLVAAMGRDVVRSICRRDGRKFVVAEASAAPNRDHTQHSRAA